MALLCKARTQDIQGKSRLYFCCVPADLTSYLDLLSEDILEIQNCGIWYPELGTDRDGDDHLHDLKEMQLFILPVSTQLLFGDCSQVKRELLFAREHHIPVLPILVEEGLADDFNQKFDQLQALDRCSADATAISYHEKLKNALDSILIGDELAAKVRAAFDAYVFLSYRKKDRAHAKELMRLIHKNEFCRDLAIWYDEFLSPGENFNHAIQTALQKSGLFVLTVTPNLVEENNYIINQEYPMAVAEHKPIVPAELVPTDKTLLAQWFQDLPDCADAHNEAQLSQALLTALEGIAVRENDSDPQHNFFIGLAYLSGIDVEVDHQRALNLITSAAEAGLMEAMDQLTRMYRTGTGVPLDIENSLLWQEKKIAALRSLHQTENSTDSFDALTSALFDCGYYYQETHAPWRCNEKYEEILTHSDQASFVSAKRCQANALSNMAGYVQRYDMDYPKAKELYQQSIAISQELVALESTIRARRSLAYSHLMLGTLCRQMHQTSEAMWHMTQSEDLYAKLYQEHKEHDDRLSLDIARDYLCMMYMDQPSTWDKALDYAQKGIHFCQQELEENPEDINRSNLATAYFRLGQVLQMDPNAKRSFANRGQIIQAYGTAYDLTKELVNINPTVRHRQDLGMCCRVLALAVGEYDQRYEPLCREAIDLLEGCFHDSPTTKNKQMLAHSYRWARKVTGEVGLLRSIQLYEELVNDGGNESFHRSLAQSYEHLANLYLLQTNDPADPWTYLPYNQAKEPYDKVFFYYKKSIDIWESLNKDTFDKDTFGSLMTRYKYLSKYYEHAGLVKEAEALTKLQEQAWEERYPKPKVPIEDVELDL